MLGKGTSLENVVSVKKGILVFSWVMPMLFIGKETRKRLRPTNKTKLVKLQTSEVCIWPYIIFWMSYVFIKSNKTWQSDEMEQMTPACLKWQLDISIRAHRRR